MIYDLGFCPFELQLSTQSVSWIKSLDVYRQRSNHMGASLSDSVALTACCTMRLLEVRTRQQHGVAVVLLTDPVRRNT